MHKNAVVQESWCGSLIFCMLPEESHTLHYQVLILTLMWKKAPFYLSFWRWAWFIIFINLKIKLKPKSCMTNLLLSKILETSYHITCTWRWPQLHTFIVRALFDRDTINLQLQCNLHHPLYGIHHVCKVNLMLGTASRLNGNSLLGNNTQFEPWPQLM